MIPFLHSFFHELLAFLLIKFPLSPSLVINAWLTAYIFVFNYIFSNLAPSFLISEYFFKFLKMLITDKNFIIHIMIL